MVLSRATYRFLIKANCIAALLFLVGCGQFKKFADMDNLCETQRPVAGASNVSLFLNINRHGTTPNLRLKILSTELLVDDLWVPFSSDVAEVNSADTVHIQRFLGRQWLKGQFCRGIRVKFEPSKLTPNGAEDSTISKGSSDTEIMLQNPVELVPDSRKVIFLEWDTAKSFFSPEVKLPLLSAYPGGASRISTNLVYVACPDIATVYVVRADQFQVVDAFAVRGKPSYLAVDSDNKRIYVLSESLSKILPFDISTHFPGSEIVIPLANSPNFMTINDSRQLAYVLDVNGVLTSIDLASGNMLNRNRIGNSPNYICYIPGFNKLAVSSTVDQTVYLVNPDSLAVEDRIILGAAPLGLLGWKDYLYIAEGTANSVAIYDLRARKILKNIHVGFEPSRFVATNNSVYVTNYGDGTISIMQGEQFSVSKEVAIGKSAREMVVSEKQRLLFVSEGECDGSIVVIDTTANQVVARVELGAKPMGITVIE